MSATGGGECEQLLWTFPRYTKGNLHMVCGEGPWKFESHWEKVAPQPAT